MLCNKGEKGNTYSVLRNKIRNVMKKRTPWRLITRRDVSLVVNIDGRRSPTECRMIWNVGRPGFYLGH